MIYSHAPTLQPVAPSYHVSILNDEQSERLRSTAPGIWKKPTCAVHRIRRCMSLGSRERRWIRGARMSGGLPPSGCQALLRAAFRYRGRSLARTRYSVDSTRLFCATEAAEPGLLSLSRWVGKRPTGPRRITSLSQQKKSGGQHPDVFSERWSERRGWGRPAVMHSAGRKEA